MVSQVIKEYSKRQSRLAKFRRNIKPTPSEWKMYHKLKKWGIKFQFNKPTFSQTIQGANFRIDFYLPKPYYTALEIDGGYHFTNEQQKKDDWKNLYLTKHRNMRVVRIKNENVYNMTKEEFLKIISSISRGQIIKI